jgi:DNA-binding NarL/FixJ family response regulator
MQAIRVLLADDHTLVREGLRALLERIPGVEVVAEAGNGREALRLIETHRPHVALMDIMMPELNGLDATARATYRFPDTRIIILSMNTDKEFVLQALHSGASGYLLKNISAAELEQAMTSVMRGEIYLSPGISRHVVEASLRHNGVAQGAARRLTPRLREVLQLIAEGHSTKSIAKTLGVSVKTPESYRGDVMDALDIRDIAGLTRYAIRMGLVSPDD